MLSERERKKLFATNKAILASDFHFVASDAKNSAVFSK